MHRSIQTTAALPLLLLMLAVPAQSQTRQQEQRLHLRSADPHECQAAQLRCDVKLKVKLMTWTTSEGSSTYCLIDAPNIYLPGPGTAMPDRTIVWELVPPQAPAGHSFRFIPATHSRGIVITSDPQSQVDITSGGLGDGSANPGVPTYFHLKTKHESQNTAIYLPVVIHLDANMEPAICAAVDPKIVNGSKP